MQFYRRLTKIKAISFDLDDTLYNNRPVMIAIEKKMVSYFARLLADKTRDAAVIYNRRFWAPYRNTAIAQSPQITHDVVALRYESYRLGLLALGFDATAAEHTAKAALDYFIQLRSDFTVPQASIALLTQLSAKYPLVSISNGNVDTKALGIEHFFKHIYHAGFQPEHPHQQHLQQGELLQQKPKTDMFVRVCQQLTILPSELLHVGDCGLADIHGALEAGCQTAWLPHYGVGKALKQLPHIELGDVSDLKRLLNA